MKNINSKTINFKDKFNIITLVIVFFACIAFFVLYLSYDDSYGFYEKDSLSSIDKAKIVRQDGMEESISLPEVIKVKGSFDVIVDLPTYKNLYDLSIMLWLPYCNAKIYDKDKLIYEVNNQKNSIIKSGAYANKIIDLPSDINGLSIRIHIEPTLKNIDSFKLEKIIFGRKSALILDMLEKDFLTILIAIVLIIIFLLAIIINLKMKEFFKYDNYSLLNLSILGFVVAIYFLTQTKTISSFFGAFKEFIYFTEYVMLNFSMIPALLYMKYKVDLKFYKLFNLAIYMIICNVVVQSILTFMKIIEFREMLTITHFFIFITIVIVFRSIIFTDSKKYSSKRRLLLPVVTIIVTTLILVIYYIIFQQHLFKNVGLIMIIALIILAFNELSSKYSDYKKGKIEAQIYKKMAMTDPLTGLKNRQAHEEFIKKINKDKMSGWILSADINELKYINDKFGHIRGDKLILCFSETLKNIQLNNDNIHSFRIGGDEFFIFIRESKNYDIENLVVEIKTKYSNCKYFKGDFMPSFAIGYCYYDYLESKSVMSVYHIADKLMYEDKEKYKRTAPI